MLPYTYMHMCLRPEHCPKLAQVALKSLKIFYLYIVFIAFLASMYSGFPLFHFIILIKQAVAGHGYAATTDSGEHIP